MIPLYLIGLLVAIFCLGLLDWRFKLAFFFKRLQTLVTIATAVVMFIVWDIAGIGFAIFHYGGSPLVLPVRLLPEFPIEEIFFLILLSYSALIVYRYVKAKV